MKNVKGIKVVNLAHLVLFVKSLVMRTKKSVNEIRNNERGLK